MGKQRLEFARHAAAYNLGRLLVLGFRVSPDSDDLVSPEIVARIRSFSFQMLDLRKSELPDRWNRLRCLRLRPSSLSCRSRLYDTLGDFRDCLAPSLDMP